MLACRVEGSGEPLVLLHAFPLSSLMWQRQINPFSKQYKLILPDLPGFGKSSGESASSISSMAVEVEKLLRHLGVTQPVWMAGLSMGGYVVFEFLRQFPNQLKGLGFFATRAAADTDAARDNRFKSIEAMESFGIGPFSKKAVKSQLGQTTQSTRPELADEVLAMMNANTAEGAIRAQKAMANRRDSSDLLAGINFPVLILAGGEDTIAPVDMMRGMHEKISGSEFYVIEEAGHLLNMEKPEEFNKRLQDFLKRKSGDQPAAVKSDEPKSHSKLSRDVSS